MLNTSSSVLVCHHHRTTQNIHSIYATIGVRDVRDAKMRQAQAYYLHVQYRVLHMILQHSVCITESVAVHPKPKTNNNTRMRFRMCLRFVRCGSVVQLWFNDKHASSQTSNTNTHKHTDCDLISRRQAERGIGKQVSCP